MQTPRRTNEERTRSTQRALLSAARQRFESDGYAATNLDHIAELAGVTKGALYHHFPTKRALYEAVALDIQDELYAHFGQRAKKTETGWDKFVEVFISFIEVAPEPGTRLFMVEAPAVLGYQRWHEIVDERSLPGIMGLFEGLQAEGDLVFEANSELARVLLAISNALGTLVSQDDDPQTLGAVVIPVWEHFLRSLKAPSPRDEGGLEGTSPREGTRSS